MRKTTVCFHNNLFVLLILFVESPVTLSRGNCGLQQLKTTPLEENVSKIPLVRRLEMIAFGEPVRGERGDYLEEAIRSYPRH